MKLRFMSKSSKSFQMNLIVGILCGFICSCAIQVHSLKGNAYWKHLLEELKDKTMPSEDIREHCGKNRYDKDLFQKRIIGGVFSRSYEWPWLVSIQLHPDGFVKSRNNKIFESRSKRNSLEALLRRMQSPDVSPEAREAIHQIIREYVKSSEFQEMALNKSTASRTNSRLSGHVCGGSLISPSWILTVKHCFDSRLEPSLSIDPTRWTVRVGEHNLREPEEFQVDHEVEKIIIFSTQNTEEEEMEDGVRNDIALMKLKKPAKINKYVQPVCLPYPEEVFQEGTVCSVAGWGVTVEGGEISPELRHIEVPLISQEVCNETFSTLMLLNPSFQIRPSVICAGNRSPIDACQFDSGGPLMCTSDVDKQYIVVGIISFGFKCASGYPGIYSRVTSFLEWIHNVTSTN